MAKITILDVQHEAGAEGMSGQGYHCASAVELAKGDIVTMGGEKASAVDTTKMAVGYAGWDTGEGINGKVLENQIFRVVSEAWVEVDTAHTAGTKVYLSDTEGELLDGEGATEESKHVLLKFGLY